MKKLVDRNRPCAGNVLQPKTIIKSTIKVLPDLLNENVLHQKYVVEGLSLRQISKEIMSSKSAVLKALQRFNIPKRSNRGHHGRPGTMPYGKTLKAGKVVEHAGEQQIIKSMQRLKNEGKSFRAIARHLTNKGIPTKGKAKIWKYQVVQQILNRVKKEEESQNV